MVSVKRYRNLIGTFEIIIGSFLILPVVLTIVLAAFYGVTSLFLITQSLGWYNLNSNNYSTDPTQGTTLMIGFFFIGTIFLVNGIWKIRSNRYFKDVNF